MSARPRRSDPEGIYEPNMTPLIDVSLVLVVILMVATPLALQSGIAVSKAASSGQRAQKAPAERLEINVLGPDSIVVNRIRVTRASLGAALRPLLEASATRRVIVRCEPQVSHGTFVGVLDEAKAQGAGEIAVVGR